MFFILVFLCVFSLVSGQTCTGGCTRNVDFYASACQRRADPGEQPPCPCNNPDFILHLANVQLIPKDDEMCSVLANQASTFVINGNCEQPCVPLPVLHAYLAVVDILKRPDVCCNAAFFTGPPSCALDVDQLGPEESNPTARQEAQDNVVILQNFNDGIVGPGDCETRGDFAQNECQTHEGRAWSIFAFTLLSLILVGFVSIVGCILLNRIPERRRM